VSDPEPEDEVTRRHEIMERSNAAGEALQSDPDAWREYLKELAEWDATLADGLDDE